MAAITLDGRQELVALYLTMFGRAPTTVQLAQMVVARENGSTLFQVAATLSTEADFALVASKDADSFANYLANALLASDVPASARAWALNWVVTQVSGTKSKAQVIAEAVQAIRATTNVNYATSKAELAADVTVTLTAIDNPPPQIQTFTLTSNADTGLTFTGSSGDDMYVGQISGDLGVGTTFTAGDALSGGAGVDTLNVTVAGAQSANVLSTATTLTGIEKVLVQNFDSAATDTWDNEFNGALWTGVTTVGLSASSATGDTSFTGLKNLVGAEMKFGNGDLTVSYAAGVGTGGTQTLALEGTTGGTFTASSAVTTVAITGTGTSNTLAALAASGATKLTINTAGALTITGSLPTNIKTIDASASTGGSSLVVGTADLTITGGAGNDSLRIDGSTIDANDSIDAGAGTSDTLTLTGAITSAANGARAVNFENLRSYQDVAAADAKTHDVSYVSGITSVGVSKMTYTDDEDDTTDDVTVSATFTNMAAGQSMVISGVSTATSDTNSTNDTGDLVANVTFSLAADTTADSGTLTLGSAFGGAVSAATSQGITLNVTANDYETLTVVSNGAATSSNTIGTLTAGDATTLNINATRALTITTLTAAGVKNIDASASTANVTISTATSLASTIVGGAGNDTFTASGLADSVNGGAGNDTLNAAAGNDTVDGGDGNDNITGGTGNDKLYGGAGNDTFADATDGNDYSEGGDGDDTFVTSMANLTSSDTIIGGAGTDTLSINDANANIDLTADILKLQNVSGVEVIGFTGLDGGDTVTINDGVVSTAGGALTLKFLTGVAGSNTINASGVLASVSTVSFTDLAGLATTYSIGNGKDNVSMGDSGDTIVVSNAAYLSGTDTLDAGTGADTLSFTNDTAATNTITATQLAGVKGAETFNINHATDTNLVNYVFTLDDTLVGNQVSVGGTFTISRDAAEDGTLKVDGSAVSTNYILSLAGEDGNDTLLGGGGNDTISGMDGNDSLTGGGGNDVFVVTGLTQAANGSDTVTDFNFGTALTSVDRVRVDVATTTAVFGRASTGLTGTADTEILVLDMAAYQDAAGAQTAVQAIQGTANNWAEAIVIWQDTLGNLNLSIYADGDGDTTADGTLETSMVRFSGLTLSGVGSLINSGDFLLV